jgi:hypothetical protein
LKVFMAKTYRFEAAARDRAIDANRLRDGE